MIRVARRFSLAALLLFAIAALPIWLHRARGPSDPCADPEQLRHLAAFGESRSLREITEHEASIHAFWAEGTFPGSRLRYRVVRDVDPFAFYELQRYFHHPSLPEDLREIRPLHAGSDVLPVHHHINSSMGPLKLTSYFFAQGVRPVTHPLPGGLSIALDQLVRGTQPVTLFLISGSAPTAEIRAAFEERANAWLASTWLEYRSVCRS